MSHFSATRHKTVISGGSSFIAAIGMNLNIPDYANSTKALSNYLQYSEAWEYQNSSGGFGPLPESYLVSTNGWPSSAPSVDPSGNYTFRKVIGAAPTAPLTVNVTWTGNVVSGGGSNWVQTSANSGTLRIDLGMAAITDPTTAAFPNFSYTITPGDPSYAHNFSITAPGAGLVESVWLSDMAEMTSGGTYGRPVIRQMDNAAVNPNMGVWPASGNGTVPWPSPTVTLANRNTPTGGNWGVATISDAFNLGYTHGHDGWPLEVQLAIAFAAGANLWTSLQPNGSNDYYDLLATIIRDYETTMQPGQTTTQPWPTGAEIFLQVGNETWNSGFPYHDQLNEEGTTDSGGNPTGFSSPYAMRYVQRSSQIFKRFELILGPAGKMNRICRVMDFQEVANPSLVDTLMPFDAGLGDGSQAKDHHDMITAAWYWDASSADPTNLTAAFPVLYTSIDGATTQSAGYQAKATAWSKRYGCYEGGNGTGWGNTAQLDAFDKDARMEVAWGYALQQFASRIGTNIPMCVYADAGLTTGGQRWGAKDYTGGPDTPASTALKNHKLGKTYLAPALTGSFTAALDMAPGTVIGTIGRRAPGSTLVLSGTTNLALDSTTGNVTITSTSGLAVGTPISYTVTESHSNSVNGPIATSLSVSVLGNQMVTNGDFSSGSTGWTVGSGVIIGSGFVTAASATTIVQQPMDYVNGATYQLTLSYNQTDGATTFGELRVNLSATNGANVAATSAAISGPGTLTLTFTSNVGAGSFLSIEAAVHQYTGTVDNISLRRMS